MRTGTSTRVLCATALLGCALLVAGCTDGAGNGPPAPIISSQDSNVPSATERPVPSMRKPVARAISHKPRIAQRKVAKRATAPRKPGWVNPAGPMRHPAPEKAAATKGAVTPQSRGDVIPLD